ncbi:hypothetical protein FISHEDRAFT_31060, partial [Fistulina hepatica ATCC 64428]
MLKKHLKVFGVDGCLGHYARDKAAIRLKPGTKPIAIPAYSMSPANKIIIDTQLEKWFKLEVIEPSKSPWSMPVVISYRNGKPRF